MSGVGGERFRLPVLLADANGLGPPDHREDVPAVLGEHGLAFGGDLVPLTGEVDINNLPDGAGCWVLEMLAGGEATVELMAPHIEIRRSCGCTGTPQAQAPHLPDSSGTSICKGKDMA